MSIKVSLTGHALLQDSFLNKGTAFSEEEKKSFGLLGLLPSNTESIDEQLIRVSNSFEAETSPIEKHIYLRALQDTNEVLFYRFIVDNIEEVLPFIYTPVVGEACELFHHIYRRARGLFISYPERAYMDDIIANIAKHRTISVIVVTDGERILGLGDQGVGGLGIPIGKLSLYTACGSINPAETLPIVLDVGTNNQERLNDVEYLGWRHTRLTDDEYDDFVDQFVQSIKRHFPNVLLQFEDFAQQHAYPLLEKYQHQLCTFNDDIQGTAAIVVSVALAACSVANTPLREQTIAVLGAGSAGCGISEQLVQAMINQGLSEQDARSRFFMVDRNGLLTDKTPGLLPFQTGLTQAHSVINDWVLSNKSGPITLEDVINNAKPTMLLGVSGQPNQFSEDMIKKMASYCKRPLIFPLSNPTSRCEATPEDLLKWTNGSALVATGSPFSPVTYEGKTFEIAQCNNSYIFPAMGLAVVACKAKHVSDAMFMSAAVALSELAPAKITGIGRLLPKLSTVRKDSQLIAKAIILQAIKDGFTDISPQDIDKAIANTLWEPFYQSYKK